MINIWLNLSWVVACWFAEVEGNEKPEAATKWLLTGNIFKMLGNAFLWLEGNIKIDLESFGIRRLGCWKLLTSRPWFISTSLRLRRMEIPCWPLKKTLRRVFPPRKYEGRVFWSSSRIGNIICQRNTFRLIPRNTPPSLPMVCNTIRIYEYHFFRKWP